MIIVQIAGGLGNQLFQYAFGRTLALRNGCELKLDLSIFENYEWHEYSLKPFNIKEEIASQKECEILRGQNLPLYKRIQRKLFDTQPTFIHEHTLLFDPKYLEVKNPAYLSGYWQSERYFSEFKEKIFSEFNIHVKPSAANQSLIDQIRSCNAISLHLRRGNFIKDESVNKKHGTTSINYYMEAINFICTKIINPVFFIFSDDILWAKENINLNFQSVFVDINSDKTDYEDLRLMSSCQHHILANSTFSWWGAWLNPSPDKIVIAPKIWFADKDFNLQTRDLIPGTWIRI